MHKKNKIMLLLMVWAIIYLLGGSTKETAFATEGMKVGQYVQLGEYKGEPILWKVIKIDENGCPWLWSEYILCHKMISGYKDGIDSADLYKDEFNWKGTNLCQWLNSDKTVINWDAEYIPSAQNTYAEEDGVYAYEKEPGFLSNFTTQEKDMLVATERKIMVYSDNINAEGGTGDYNFEKLYDDNYFPHDAVLNFDTARYITTRSQVFLLNVKELAEIIQANNLPLIKTVHDQSEIFPDTSYWIETPGPGCAMKINSFGKISTVYGFINMREVAGVCPTIVLDRNKINITGGEGTKNSPYLFNSDQRKTTNTQVSLVSKHNKLLKYNDFTRLPISKVSGPECIAYDGKGLYVALGTELCKTSKDGIKWIPHKIDLASESGTEFELHTLIYGNNRFVAVGKGMYFIYTSTDGINWAPVKFGKEKAVAYEKRTQISNIVWTGKEFVGVGSTSQHSHVIWKSEDGLKWSTDSITGIAKDVTIQSMKYCNETFYCVGGVGDEKGIILKSSDGVNWNKVKSFSDHTLYDFVYENGTFLTIGNYGFTASSNNLKDWSTNTVPDHLGNMSRRTQLIYYQNHYYAFGYIGIARNDNNPLFIYSSSDGKKWSELDEPEMITGEGKNEYISYLKAVTQIGDMLYATTGNFDIVNSQDAKTWDLRSRAEGGSGFSIQYLSYANGMYFASSGFSFFDKSNIPIGNKKPLTSFYISKDGINWDNYSGALPGKVYNISWNGSCYIGYGMIRIDEFRGYDQVLFTSKNGYEWDTVKFKFDDHPIELEDFFTYNIDKFAYVNGRFIMAVSKQDKDAFTGYLYTSKDGLTWSRIFQKANYVFEDIAYGNGIYAFLGDKYIDQGAIDSALFTTKDLNKFTIKGLKKAYFYLDGLYFDGKVFNFIYGKHTESNSEYQYYLAVSKDCKTWTTKRMTRGIDIYGTELIHEGGYYFYENAYPLGVEFNMSKDGANWYNIDQLCDSMVYSILWDGEKLIIGGYNSIYVYKP